MLLLCSEGEVRRGRRITKSSMFGKTGYRAKSLPTFAALDLHSTIGMHSFMSAKVGKLGITFVANLATKWFYTAVDMCMLLETRAGGKRLPALWTRVTSCSNMVCADVSL